MLRILHFATATVSIITVLRGRVDRTVGCVSEKLGECGREHVLTLSFWTVWIIRIGSLLSFGTV
jgi:hypothetical protein